MKTKTIEELFNLIYDLCKDMPWDQLNTNLQRLEDILMEKNIEEKQDESKK